MLREESGDRTTADDDVSGDFSETTAQYTEAAGGHDTYHGQRASSTPKGWVGRMALPLAIGVLAVSFLYFILI